jgi:hypothetical protein
MSATYLDPGLYTNVFEVRVPDELVTVMVASTAEFPDLRPIREEIRKMSLACWVYQVGDRVYGYGDKCEILMERSFQQQTIRLREEPRLCARLIQEGLVHHLRGQGYREWSGKGRVTLYEPEPYRIIASSQLRVYRGYDLRTIWWKQYKDILFGLVVDVCWEIQDSAGNRLNPSEIARYGAMREIGQIQEELLSTGQINTEVARLRLQNHILPFVNKHGCFPLPCGGTAKLSEVPVRVVLGG